MASDLGRDEFAKTSELELEVRPGSNQKWWRICQEYELREPLIGATGDYGTHRLAPTYSPDKEDKWRTYNPLQDTPDLFLRFARLYDNEKGLSTDAVLEWVHRYGLLGYGGEAYLGGPDETISAYRTSIRWAAGILAMYEAALNEDEEAARNLVLGEFLSVALRPTPAKSSASRI